MSSEKYKQGMALRREVLGDEYVDNAIKNATSFTKPLQDIVTENCWGEIWARKAIPKATRSLITCTEKRLYGRRNTRSSPANDGLLWGTRRD